jgi:hypothetical protein
MKWRSHIQIAESVGSELGLDENEKRELIKGSVAPDGWRDHSRHHNRKYLDIIIVERIEKCRRLFLNRKPSRFFEMGVVLHYIADRLLSETSYLEHVDIEEEMAKISETRKRTFSYTQNPTIRSRDTADPVSDLDIEESAKTLLLDHHLVEGKRNTLILSLTDVPEQTGYTMLMDIANRISSGVAYSVMSGYSPGEVLRRKFQVAGETISRAIPGLKRYLVLMLVLPFLFLGCGKIGWAACAGTLAVCSWGLWPIILIILNRGNRTGNYLVSCDRTKTLLVFFVLGSATLFGAALLLDAGFFFPGAVLLLVALAYLFLPRIAIGVELKDEINWYDWN